MTYLLRYLRVRRVRTWLSHLVHLIIMYLASVDKVYSRGCREENFVASNVISECHLSVSFCLFTLSLRRPLVEFLCPARDNEADIIISSTAITARIDDRMNMQP